MSIQEVKEDLEKIDDIYDEKVNMFPNEKISPLIQRHYTKDEFVVMFFEWAFATEEENAYPGGLSPVFIKIINSYVQDINYEGIILFMQNFSNRRIRLCGLIEQAIFAGWLEFFRGENFDRNLLSNIDYVENFDINLQHTIILDLETKITNKIEAYERALVVLKEINIRPKEICQMIAEYTL